MRENSAGLTFIKSLTLMSIAMLGSVILNVSWYYTIKKGTKNLEQFVLLNNSILDIFS